MIFAFVILLLSVLLLDLYGYFGLRSFLRSKRNTNLRRSLLLTYWIIDVLFVIFSIVWIIVIRNSSWPDHVQYRSYFYISGAFVLIFLPKVTFIFFVILNDLKNLLFWIFKKISKPENRSSSGKSKSGSLKGLGIVLSVLMFIWVFYGIFFGRFNFRIEQVEVYFEDLPESFDGYQIAHFSDTHLGSFARIRPVAKGLEMVRNLNSDMVIFSGDLVNNEAVEILPYLEHFKEIQSPDGNFTVLGNHDMGDYRRWYTIKDKEVNLRQLEEFQEQMGFNMLRNEHTFIVNGSDSIMLVGIDNWGEPPFAQYGDLEEALGEHAAFPFKVLISHDPSHWKAEVIPETDIQLMLAGHTHGMQLGIRTPWFSWSPSSLIYPQWNGLYHHDNQALYVNRGFGFLGFPGRIGMSPEITLITLKKGKSGN